MDHYRNVANKLFTPRQRTGSLAKTSKAKFSRQIPFPTRCAISGSRYSVNYHNEDYSHHTDYLIPMSWKVHMLWHNYWHSPEKVAEALRDIIRGRDKEIFPIGTFWWLQSKYGILRPSKEKKEDWFSEDTEMRFPTEHLVVDVPSLFLVNNPDGYNIPPELLV